MLAFFSKEVAIDISLKNSSVYVRANIEKTPRSVIDGSITLSLAKGIAITDISISLWKKVSIKYEMHTTVGDRAYIKKDRINTYQIFSSSESKPNSSTPLHENVDSKVGLNLDSGKASYNFYLWVPDALEPTFSNKSLLIEYYLTAHIAYKTSSSFLYKSRTVESRCPIRIQTLPQILNPENSQDFLNPLSFWNICMCKNRSIILSLPSKVFVSSKENLVAVTLTIEDSSKNCDSIYNVKSIYIRLIQEINYARPIAKPYKNTIRLFQKALRFNLSDTKNQTIKADPDLNASCSDKESSKGEKKQCYSFALPFIASEYLPSIALSEFSAYHHLAASVEVEDKTTGKTSYFYSDFPIKMITPKINDFINSLPSYSESLGRTRETNIPNSLPYS